MEAELSGKRESKKAGKRDSCQCSSKTQSKMDPRRTRSDVMWWCVASPALLVM